MNEEAGSLLVPYFDRNYINSFITCVRSRKAQDETAIGFTLMTSEALIRTHRILANPKTVDMSALYGKWLPEPPF
jgi:hypothetical protein